MKRIANLSWVLLVAVGCAADASSDVGSAAATGKADDTTPTEPTPTEPTPTEPTVPAEADIYAQAKDVALATITFPAGSLPRETYRSPFVPGFSLFGTEFWQQWSGGHSPTYNYGDGTAAGRLCMQASAIRFDAIMANPPEEMVRLRDETNWSGAFFNWNDDYTQANSNGGRARLWAWKTSLMKWISATHKDGSCSLPTLEMVKRAASNCLETGLANAGEIQGCRS